MDTKETLKNRIAWLAFQMIESMYFEDPTPDEYGDRVGILDEGLLDALQEAVIEWKEMFPDGVDISQ